MTEPDNLSFRIVNRIGDHPFKFQKSGRHGLEIEPVSGLFLGLNREEKYDKGTLRFQAGDSFFFITDGLYDLLPQPVAAAMNFDRLQEMFKVLISGSNRRDDASGIGILIR